MFFDPQLIPTPQPHALSDPGQASAPVEALTAQCQKFVDDIRRPPTTRSPSQGGPLTERLTEAANGLRNKSMFRRDEHKAFKSIVNDHCRQNAAGIATDANSIKARLQDANGFLSTYPRSPMVPLVKEVQAELVRKDASQVGASAMDSREAKRLPDDYLTYSYRCRAARDHGICLPQDKASWPLDQRKARTAHNGDTRVQRDFAQDDTALEVRVSDAKTRFDACMERMFRECGKVLDDEEAFPVLTGIDVFIGDPARASKTEEGLALLASGGRLIRALTSEHAEAFDHYSPEQRQQLTSLVTDAVDWLAAQMEADAPRLYYPLLTPVATSATPSASAHGKQ